MKQHLNASNALPSLDVPLLLLHIILIFQTLTTTTRAQGTFFFDNRVPGSWVTNFIGLHDCSNNSSNYTSGSQFESNLLNDVLPTLIANGSRDNFVMATFGEVPDKVYGLVHCRGDISEEDCLSCLKIASANITQSCPNKKSAGLRLGNCLIRYSDTSFFNKSSINLYKGWNWENDKPITNLSDFNKKLDGLFINLNSDASKIPSRFKSGWTELRDLGNIYGLVQCTEDLSTTDCLTCLQKMVDEIPNCCSGVKGVWITSLSCQIMYGRNLFFRLPSPPSPLLPSPSPPPPPPVGATPSQQTTGKSPNVAVIVVPIIIGSLLLLSVALCCVYLAKRKTRRRKRETTEAARITGRDPIHTAESLQFDLVTIINATNNFSDANKLGEGGFGAVYKGELPDGEEIAVKRLSSKSGQGSQEFKNEVVLLHKLQHRNLVRLLGFCLEGEEKILIYEFVPNTSLDKYLFDPLKRTYLDWQRRYKIVGGIARGLLYLHEDSRLRIIHRDLKAGNILLDEEMTAKIADFGLAKLFEVDQTHGNTNRIAGTFGYMAPEYTLHGQFSVKSDVFSFGVLLLEIVSGQKVNSFYQSSSSQDLLSYAWKHWRQGTTLEFMDPALTDSYARDEVMRCIHIGLLCVQDNIEERPTMSSVVLMLNSYSLTLSTPSQPEFFASNRTRLIKLGKDQEKDKYSGNSSSRTYSADGLPDTTTMPR